MAGTVEEKALAYRSLIRDLAHDWPRYEVLNNFVNIKRHVCELPAKITVVSMRRIDTEPHYLPDIAEVPDQKELCRLLGDTDQQYSSRLFLVENVCPETIALLGGHFDLDPQFFAAHIRSDPWYRVGTAPDHLPILPSSLKEADFLQIRYICPLVLSKSGDSTDTSQLQSVAVPVGIKNIISSEESHTWYPDESSTRVSRRAGKLVHLPRPGVGFDPLMYTYQYTTIWFQGLNSHPRKNGWSGIILLDPPFQLPPGSAFRINPSASLDFGAMPNHSSNRTEVSSLASAPLKKYCHYLHKFLQNNTGAVNAIQSRPDVVLHPLYELVVHDWFLCSLYLGREIAGIEYFLGEHATGFTGHEVHLKDLCICRRRCFQYQGMLQQTKEQHLHGGQSSWYSNKARPALNTELEDCLGAMDENLDFLLQRFAAVLIQIERNISLINSLVTIGQTQQALEENHGVARLTLLATFFLPFSTIATFLSIQGNYGVGGSQFWVFWVVVIPLTTFIVLFFKRGSQLLSLWNSFHFSSLVRRRTTTQEKGQRD